MSDMRGTPWKTLTTSGRRFAAQQGAEKALKALILTRGGEPWGHSITGLVEALPRDMEDPAESWSRPRAAWTSTTSRRAIRTGSRRAIRGSSTHAARRRERSRMRRRSSSSAGAVYLDPEQRIEELRAGARRAAARLPGVQRVILFGSLAAGIPTPRSGRGSARRRCRERAPRATRPGGRGAARIDCPSPALSTSSSSRPRKLARHTSEGNPLLREALDHGRDLL